MNSVFALEVFIFRLLHFILLLRCGIFGTASVGVDRSDGSNRLVAMRPNVTDDLAVAACICLVPASQRLRVGIDLRRVFSNAPLCGQTNILWCTLLRSITISLISTSILQRFGGIGPRCPVIEFMPCTSPGFLGVFVVLSQIMQLPQLRPYEVRRQEQGLNIRRGTHTVL